MISWRYVDTGPLSAGMNMAVDEALAISVMNGFSPPVLRLYSWSGPAVSIGYFQKSTDIDLNLCTQNNIPVIRRQTGGRAILHGNEVTYSFSARREHHSTFRTLHDSYEILSQAFLKAFMKMGLDVEVRKRKEKVKIPVRRPHCFDTVSFAEIVHEGKKIIGSAQRRMREGFMQQGSIPLSIDRELHGKVFGYCTETFGAVQNGRNTAGSDLLKESILQGFQEAFQVVLKKDEITPGEMREAERLLRKKYSSPQWLERR